MSELLSSGLALCIREPRNGEHGLEGYNEGERHRYEERRGVLASRKSQGEVRYYRVWPGSDLESTYFEVCMPGIFHRFFREVT
jgi:hypothetical protein